MIHLDPSSLLQLVTFEKSKRAAERKLYEFVRQAWHVIEPGVPFVESWHIEEICAHLEAITDGDIKRLLINIPPRHSKSTITVMWSVWEWIEHPDHKFLCASYSGSLSIRDNLKARRLIESPWFQKRWGDRFHFTGDQNQKGRFENNKTGYRIATSVGGTATGEGGNRLLLDDPHGAQDAQSDALRGAAIEWFDMVWSTRLNNPKTDAMVTIMQRLHMKDVSGHIIEDIGGWEHICIPAEFDGRVRRTSLGLYDPRKQKGELICPERMGVDEIKTLKLLLGSYGAAGQLQQDPTPSEGGILKVKHFRLWPSTKRMPVFEFLLQSYDTAFTEPKGTKKKTKQDPTGCEVWGVFTFNGVRNAMLLDAWDEHLGYPALRKKVVADWTSIYGADSAPKPGMPTKGRRPDRILVEAKASGQSLLQDLRQGHVPAVGYNPGHSDKISRAHQAAPILEAGLLWLPESAGSPGKPATWSDGFMRQIERFPLADHDEYVDCLTQAVIYLRDEGLLVLNKAAAIEEDRPPQKEFLNPYAA